MLRNVRLVSFFHFLQSTGTLNHLSITFILLLAFCLVVFTVLIVIITQFVILFVFYLPPKYKYHQSPLFPCPPYNCRSSSHSALTIQCDKRINHVRDARKEMESKVIKGIHQFISCLLERKKSKGQSNISQK